MGLREYSCEIRYVLKKKQSTKLMLLYQQNLDLKKIACGVIDS